MVQVSWVGARPCIFLFILFSIFILFFFPYERANYPDWGRRFLPLYLDPFLFDRSSPLSFLLAIDARRPRSDGRRSVIVKSYRLIPLKL